MSKPVVSPEAVEKLRGRVSAATLMQIEPGKTTLSELRDLLAADAQWVEGRAKEDERRQRMAERWERAEVPLVRDLQAAGLSVVSVWDLVNTSEPYPDALPILLRHLERPYPDRVREGIARAMAVRGGAKFAWNRLCELYRQEPVDTDAKNGLAVALAAVVDESTMEELIALLRDVRHGESRIFFVRPVSRSRDPRAREALDELADDPHLQREIALMRGAERPD